MKAKEYFEKYGSDIMNEGFRGEVSGDGFMAKLYMEMFHELKEMIDRRHIQKDDSFMALVEEQNDKWNAIERLFIKKYGVSPIAHNGFMAGVKTELNENH